MKFNTTLVLSTILVASSLIACGTSVAPTHKVADPSASTLASNGNSRGRVHLMEQYDDGKITDETCQWRVDGYPYLNGGEPFATQNDAFKAIIDISITDGTIVKIAGSLRANSDKTVNLTVQEICPNRFDKPAPGVIAFANPTSND